MSDALFDTFGALQDTLGASGSLLPVVQQQSGVASLPNAVSGHPSWFSDSPDDSAHDFEEFFRGIVALVVFQDHKSNFKALVSRFIEIFHEPEQLAPLVLDFWSLPLSIVWRGRQSGPDLLYPFLSLKKLKSGRLARLLLEHSRDIQQHNIRVATSIREGIDPPRVAVIDLDAPQKPIDKEYKMSADFYGLVVMMLLLEVLITLFLHIFLPIDGGLFGNWLGEWATYFFGDRFGTWIGHWATILFGAAINWINGICFIFFLCGYASFRGEGTLTLVRKSDISAQGCAILLDRDFALILTGTQNIVEAIAESGFIISHPVAWRYHIKGWQFGQWLCYSALEAVCQGIPFAILAGFWLLISPSSLLMAFLPLVPTTVISFRMMARTMVPPTPIGRVREQINAAVKFFARIGPAFLLISVYEFIVAKDALLRGVFHPTIWFHHVPNIFMAILVLSSRNYHVRTAKLLDVLGHPPVRRWEFDTEAAAVTFQCLVLCRSLPRPIRDVDVLTLLDTIFPDQTDVWKAWKERVADRIAHEVDTNFSPTLPSFGDERQKGLKELLDQAQVGYDEYTKHYCPRSTIASSS